MTNRSKRWLISALIYGAFVFWYTDFGGPVTDNEIDQWKQSMTESGASAEKIAFFEAFLREDTGRQFLMVNSLDLNDNPPNVDSMPPGETAQQLMARYMEHMFVELLSNASHPVIIGSVPYSAIDLIGIDGAEHWEQGAVFRYRSRRTFMQIVGNPITREKHHFKTAALEKTIAYPLETSFYLGDLRFILALLLLCITALLDSFVIAKRAKQGN